MRWPRQLQVFLAVGGCVLIVGLLASLVLSRRGSTEPGYNGEPLTRWMGRAAMGHGVWLLMPEEDVLTALREMGAPPVEYLVRWSTAPTNSAVVKEAEALAQEEDRNLRDLNAVERILEAIHKRFMRSSKPSAMLWFGPGVIQQNAQGVLFKLKPDADVLLPLLSRRLVGNDPAERARGFSLLGFVEEHAEKTVPFVLRGLEDGNEAVRAAAAGAVGWGNIKSQGLVGPLLAAMERGSETNRMAFVLALGQSGPAATEALPVLLKLLDEKLPIPIQRLLIAGAICQINPAQPEGLAVLLSALDDPQHRGAAWQVLGQIKPRPDIPAERLKEALRDSDLVLRGEVLDALLNLSESKEDSISALLLALGARDSRIQLHAASRLLRLEANNQNAIAALSKLVQDPARGIRFQAADVLGNLGTNASSAIPALETLRITASPQLKRRIESALQKIRAARPVKAEGKE